MNSVHSRSIRLLLRGVLLTERSHAMTLNWNAKNRNCRIYHISPVNARRTFVSYSNRLSRRLILLAWTWSEFPLRQAAPPRFQEARERVCAVRETRAPSIRAQVPRHRFDATTPFQLDLIA
jgi:hypothetical protein